MLFDLNFRRRLFRFVFGMVICVVAASVLLLHGSPAPKVGHVTYDDTEDLVVEPASGAEKVSASVVQESRSAVDAVRRLGGTVLLSDAGQVISINLTGCNLGKGDLQLVQDTPELYLLNLDNSNASDEDLVFVHDLERLRFLRLSRTSVTDNGLKHFRNLPVLYHLFLNDTAVTDDGMRHLWGLSGLSSVIAMGSRVTPRARQILRERLPKCNVKY